MYSDDQGFNSFKIVRACDLKLYPSGKNGATLQEIKF